MARKPTPSPEAAPETDAADADAGLDLPGVPVSPAGDAFPADASPEEAPAGPSVPELVTHTDLPVRVDCRLVEDGRVLLVTVDKLPGWVFAPAPSAPAPAPPPELQLAELLSWRELDDGSGEIIGVTRDGQKVRGAPA